MEMLGGFIIGLLVGLLIGAVALWSVTLTMQAMLQNIKEQLEKIMELE